LAILFYFICVALPGTLKHAGLFQPKFGSKWTTHNFGLKTYKNTVERES